MKLSKLFHSLYFMVMFLPLFIIPIFAININQKSVEPISIEVQEKVSVDFNQKYINTRMVNYNYNFYVDRDELIYVAYNETTLQQTLYYQIPNILETNHTYIVKIINDNTQYVDFYIGGTYYYPSGTNTNYERKFVATANALNVNFRTGFIFSEDEPFTFSINVYDLTQMNLESITIEDFEIMFPNIYPYTESQIMLVDKPSPTTYNDTDIGSQFLYSLYKPIQDYFNFGQYFGLNGIYDWFQLNFFNGNAPLPFFIFFNLMIYWLLISLLWLLFDVLIYVPMMIHRWLDKGALE